MIRALHLSHLTKSQTGNLVLVCAFVHLHVHFVCILSFGAVHIWCRLGLGPCWCTLLVLKTDTEHTKHTADGSPIIGGLYADRQAFKRRVDIVQRDRKLEPLDKQVLVCSNM